MDAPPDEGCPNWDQTFDFDLRVWSCATRPLDADPKKLAERVKNCGAPTVKKYWDHSMILAINYAPWETVEGINALRDEAGYTERDFNEAGFEKWVRARANREYFDTIGVRGRRIPAT